MEVLIIVANNIQNPYNLAVCVRLLMLDCVRNNRLKLLNKSMNCKEYYKIRRDLRYMSEKGLNRAAILVNIPNVLDSNLFAEYKLYKFELVKWEIFKPYFRDLRNFNPDIPATPRLRARVIKMNGDNGSIDWNKGTNKYIDSQLYCTDRLTEFFVLECDKRGFLNLFNSETYKTIALIKEMSEANLKN